MVPRALFVVLQAVSMMLAAGAAGETRDDSEPPVTAQIAVRVSMEQPEVDLYLPAKGALRGALRRAGGWGGQSEYYPSSEEAVVYIAMQELGAPFLAARLALGMTTSCVTGIVGAGSGAVSAKSAEDVERTEREIRMLIEQADIQENLAKYFVAEGASAASLKCLFSSLATLETEDPEIAKAIELVVKAVRLKGEMDVDPVLFFILDVEMKEVEPGGYRIKNEHCLRYQGNSMTLDRWRVQIAKEIEIGLKEVARLAVENIFLDPEPYHVVSLKPECPMGKELPVAGRVDSRQPSLAWQPYTHSGDLSKITGITYDIRIWKMENGLPGPLVYERKGLPDAQHFVEELLDFGTIYYWSFRARFFDNGRPRITTWSHHPLRRTLTYLPTRPPIESAYCFKTPSDSPFYFTGPRQ